ncbi:hypothetical protein AAY473_018936 [Plecturocebus cupreus]
METSYAALKPNPNHS